jgi:1-pyrroline-5-carboxylate dehydrogenase
VGQNLEKYRSDPRLLGETGGKDFIFALQSADPKALVTAILRGAFEYQGRKRSGASRAYIPSNLWARTKDELVAEVEGMKMGDPRDFSNFMGAVFPWDRYALRVMVHHLRHAAGNFYISDKPTGRPSASSRSAARG